MLTIVLQAGGKSSRMGEDKALRSFLGIPLIQRMLNRFENVGEETLVITNNFAGYDFLGVQLYADVIPDRGALGGLYTALNVASQPYVALIATDLPFASPALITHATNLIQHGNVDAVIPSTTRGLEPLHAVYQRETCLPLVKEAIDQDRWRMITWHDQANIQVLSPEKSLQVSGSALTFMNVNTPDEFRDAEHLARTDPGL